VYYTVAARLVQLGTGSPRKIEPVLQRHLQLDNNSTTLQLGISTNSATHGAKSILIRNPDGQSKSGARLLTVTPALSVIERWRQM
jgi:hypothetical protein